MKIKVENYEVEIKAKGNYDDDYNMEDTCALLNLISLLASSASRAERAQGYNALAKSYANIATKIMCQIEDENPGYYYEH